MPISATCPKCATRLQLDAAHAGRRALCPRCKTEFIAPAADAAAPKPAGGIAISCPHCAGKLQVHPEAAGKQIRCGQCKGVFAAPGGDTRTGPTPDAAPPSPEKITESKVEPKVDATAPPTSGRTRRFSAKLLVFGCLGLTGFLCLCTGIGSLFVWTNFVNETFHETPRDYRAGTMTQIQKIGEAAHPHQASRMVLSGKHKLVFLMHEKEGIAIYDIAAKKWLDPHPAQARCIYVDMDISPSQDFVFAADRATEKAPDGITKHFVHRFDLARRQWEVGASPLAQVDVYTEKRINSQYVRVTKSGTREFHREPARIKAIADERLFVTVHVALIALWQWHPGNNLTEQSSERTQTKNFGLLEYDPRTGLVYFDTSTDKGPPISIKRISGTWFFNPSVPHSAEDRQKLVDGLGVQIHAAPFLLSSNGKWLYRSNAQLATADPNKLVRLFSSRIHAASDDLAFGDRDFFNAQTGEKVGELGHGVTVADISIDGAYFSALDGGGKMLHVYEIAGQK